MCYKKYLYILVFLGIFFNHAQAQKSKHQLEKEKEENLARIKTANKILKETKNKQKATLGQLTAIQQQIISRNQLINSISEEIELLNQDIFEIQDIISALENDINLLKKEYAAMIYSASKSQNFYNYLTFLFSAETFNQLLNRIKYFQQYSESRKKEVKEIEIVKKSLFSKQIELNKIRAEKNTLLLSKTQETQNLTSLKDQQDRVLQELTSTEKELKAELADRQNADKKLEKLITDLIAFERQKAMKEAAKNLASEKKKVDLTNESSGNFAVGQGKLPWPVVHGNIANKFGRQPHSVLKGVFVDNLGVDIQTLKNEPVRAVFKGKVITVANVPGMNMVVMIQHGEYFTVYAKLKTVSVTTGQEIKAKEIIGEVYTDKNELSSIQFQIWKNSEKLDPEKWIMNK